jgi:hypothetical protein
MVWGVTSSHPPDQLGTRPDSARIDGTMKVGV